MTKPYDIPTDILHRHRTLLTELKNQSDVGLAIIGGAIIDEQLKRVLRSGLKGSVSTLKRVFEYPGPLSSASACIDMSVLLGVYGEITHCDLRIINGIRNDFAHTVTPLEVSNQHEPLLFSHKTISAQCSSFKFLEYTLKTVEDLDEGIKIEFMEAMKTPRNKFFKTIQMISAFLYTKVLYSNERHPPSFTLDDSRLP